MKKIIISIMLLSGVASAFAAPFKFYSRNTKGGGPNGYDYTHVVHTVVWPWEFTDIVCKNPGNEACPSTVTTTSNPSLVSQEISIANSLVAYADTQIGNGTTSGSKLETYYITELDDNITFRVDWSLNTNGEQIVELYKYQ